MFFKKAITALSAAALTAATVIPASAIEVPEADADGVYCQAGIVFQIRDQWDHRNEIQLEPLDETESTVLDITFKDVNVTGNGEYTVEMLGYQPEYTDDICGFLAVELDIDFSKYADLEKGEGVSFELTKAVIDGTEYTFTNGLTDDGKPLQALEDGEKFDRNQKIIKLKNGWGAIPDFSDPDMPSEVWGSADPVSISFKVSGLPTDKIENFDKEVVERVYGKGTNVEAPEESSVEESSAAESVEESSAAPAESEAASSAADTSKADDSSKADSEESSNVGLIIGICAAVAVVIAVVAVVIKKKS